MLARFRVHALLALTIVVVLLAAMLSGEATSTPSRVAARPVAAVVPASEPAVPAARVAANIDGARCRGLVALTFDDGPVAGRTEHLVHLLRGLHVPATFFMVGSRVAAAESTARAVARAGFPIGNHTWAHRDLALQSAVD
ncbi:MAG TPA: polysaccharide deacetylase family protein, partial [Nocardioides sp.]|nr:polysaccharide deacetylase family protein [Nocardioides sp.]